GIDALAHAKPSATPAGSIPSSAMPSALSKDLRERIVWSCLDGGTNEEVAERHYVSVRTVQRVWRCWELNGTVNPPEEGSSGRSCLIDDQITEYLRTLLVLRADWYLDELQRELKLYMG
ncbi:hypothetical protein HK102_004995, partial [Quaeritorhiza haematococci]